MRRCTCTEFDSSSAHTENSPSSTAPRSRSFWPPSVTDRFATSILLHRQFWSRCCLPLLRLSPILRLRLRSLHRSTSSTRRSCVSSARPRALRAPLRRRRTPRSSAPTSIDYSRRPVSHSQRPAQKTPLTVVDFAKIRPQLPTSVSYFRPKGTRGAWKPNQSCPRSHKSADNTARKRRRSNCTESPSGEVRPFSSHLYCRDGLVYQHCPFCQLCPRSSALSCRRYT
mmetsp:Transcript_106745/g.297113  ORF Transcript_106745/g.297113 Transcript_106745/m.297113 type:complete len:226 (+) Transcript_106745:42-719(+)